MKKFFITDLDGTLLNKESSLSEFSKNSLKELLKRDDFNFSVATGRDFYIMKSPLRGLDLKIPLISNDGSYVSNLNDPRPLYVKEIERDNLEMVYNFLKEHKFSVFFKVVYRGDIFNIYDGMTNFFEHWYLMFKDTFYYSNMIKVDGIKEFSSYNVLSMMVIGEKTKIKEIYFDITSKYLELKVVTYDRLEFNSTVSILEVQHKDAEKINGIKFLADYLSISYKDIVYFGDAENDISVFNEDDIYKITLQNGIEELKGKASEIIDYHYNDAVLKYILNSMGK